MKTEQRETIDAIMASVNKKYGDEVIVKGSRVHEELSRITTGILAYDLMTGGGWPVNQWSEIIGDESSGKTALAYKTIAANQAINPDWIAMWVAAEEFVPEYAKAIGVDLDRLWVVETNIMEHAYDLVNRALDNRAVDCIVIDSLPALIPGDEAEKMMEVVKLTNDFTDDEYESTENVLVSFGMGLVSHMVDADMLSLVSDTEEIDMDPRAAQSFVEMLKNLSEDDDYE